MSSNVSKQDACVGTDPLRVKLYFDENNKICSEIIFSEPINGTEQSSTNVQRNNFIIIDDNSQKTEIPDIFTYFTLVNHSTTMNNTYNTNNDYQSIDYIKYNRSYNLKLSQHDVWTRQCTYDDFSLTLTKRELQEKETIFSILTLATHSTLKYVTITFDGLSNISHVHNSINFGTLKYAVLNGERIGTNLKSIVKITSFMISREKFDEFSSLLQSTPYTWENCLLLLMFDESIDRIWTF